MRGRSLFVGEGGAVSEDSGERDQTVTVEILQDLIRGPVIQAAAHIRFDPGAKDEFLIAALYCSIVELADAIGLLIHWDRSMHAFPLARAQFEAYADFQNLLSDHKYAMVLFLQDEKSWVYWADLAKSGNPLLSSLTNEMDDHFVQAKKQKIAKLEADGAKK